MGRTSALEVGTASDLEYQIGVWRQLVEHGLEEHLPPVGKPSEPRLDEAIRYSTLGGGHRYRPILLLAVAHAFGARESTAVRLACVVEMIHTAAMILDDLPSFDDAEIRHGKPACHKQFGEYMAICASNRMLSLCLDIMRSLRNDVGAAGLGLLEEEYTTLINAMIRGEAWDLATRHERIDASPLIEIYIGKSAHLFSFAAVSGAVLGRARAKDREALREYGLNLGLAYQILDDIYYVVGGPSNVGKAAGMDAKNEKATTFPLLYGVDRSRTLLEEYKGRACLAIEEFGERLVVHPYV